MRHSSSSRSCYKTCRLLLAVSVLIVLPRAALSQATPDNSQDTIRTMEDKIERLERRLAEVEAKQAASVPAESDKTATPAVPATESPVAAEASPVSDGEVPHEHTMEIPGGPQLRIRGFSDVDYHVSNQSGTTNGFALGAFDLFVSSQISEKFSMLSEVNFEFGDDNEMAVDLERMLLTYTANDHFKLSFGRYHTAIGYYNTTFHHGTWFQTATGRPFLFFFEDEGGVLPVHNVGLSLTGTIPSGTLGLHYVAEIGNGRPARVPQNTTVQNVVDENNGKAVNLGFWLRPEWLSGLQVGASVYHDHLTPNIPQRIQEYIPALHAVYTTSKFEWLNEAVLIRHSLDGGRTFNTPGFYTQISRQWRDYRPYFRYQYINASPLEPLLRDAGMQQGPSLGLRYDWSEFAALKIQYDRNLRRSLQDLNQLGLQMAFTF
jgi:hypothetical protein